MGYFSSGRGQWMSVEDLTLLAAQTVAASGAGPSRETASGVARLTLDVTATSGDGTQTLDVAVETSEDDATWRQVGTFPQVGAAAATHRAAFAGVDRFVRVAYTVTGGGAGVDYTFSVAGEAV